MLVNARPWPRGDWTWKCIRSGHLPTGGFEGKPRPPLANVLQNTGTQTGCSSDTKHDGPCESFGAVSRKMAGIEHAIARMEGPNISI
jgi:hypothetical protein